MMHTGEAGDTIFLAERLASAVGVNLGNDDLVFCVCKSISQLLVDGSKVLWGGLDIAIYIDEQPVKLTLQ